MYHHSFLFVIISNNNQIENALRAIAPLEDCDYAFRTVAHVRDAAVDLQKPDMAFVYDHIGGAEFSKEKGECGERILVVNDRTPLLTDRTVVEAVSEMWVMPEREEYDGELLRTYFGRLTERMKQRADARKQGICFETLVNSVPDISWFKDISGAHLIVNGSFCEMVGKTKEQIYKKGHCYIWNASKEDEEVCLNSDRIIMESRKTNSFEETVKTGTDTLLLKSYKSALVDVDGEIFGTCGIAHDVTALRNMNTELDMVLDSVPYAMLVEDMQGIVLNKNSQFDKYFPQFTDIVGKSSEEWRKSLTKKLLLEDRLKEVVVQPGDEEQILVFDEEPILDNFRRNIGRIVTLTDITLERNIVQQSQHMANTDYLTGLNNRRSMMNYLEELPDVSDVTLVMLDLDNFKQVNDHFGHDAGNRALKLTADNLRASFTDDFVARMGGDEFMVVAVGRQLDEIKQGAEQLLELTREAYRQHEEFTGMTVSVGIAAAASLPERDRNVSGILQTVDSLLYEAKGEGKDRYCVYGEK